MFTVWLLMQDAKYLDDKLRDLASVAEDAIATLDEQVRNIQGNITELESIREDDLTAVRLAPDSWHILLSVAWGPV